MADTPGSPPPNPAAAAPPPEAALLAAAAAGDLPTLTALLSSGADPAWQCDATGTSPLMVAATAGAAPCVSALLAAGAPWNAVDRGGACAGELANGAGHGEAAEALFEAGVRAELVLGALESALRGRAQPSPPPAAAASASTSAAAPPPSTPPAPGYLDQALSYAPGPDGAARLADEQGRGVMMGWEAPLMVAHAHAVCRRPAGQGGEGGEAATHVLNIGFGLGLVDSAIAARAPTTHTICEPHPDVLARMRSEGWFERPGVSVIPLTWQAAWAEGRLHPPAGAPASKFTGVFFDPFEEADDNVAAFHDTALPHLLAPGGTYSFFNGLNADNPFFHAVSCEVVARRLRSAGLEVAYVPLPLPADATASATWGGVTNRYWQLETYSLPVVTWEDDEGE